MRLSCFVIVAALLASAPLEAIAQADTAFASTPRNPEQVLIVDASELSALVSYRVSLSETGEEIRLQSYPVIQRVDRERNVDVRLNLSSDYPTWPAAIQSSWVSLTIGVGREPVRPDEASTIHVSGFSGWIDSTDASATAVVVPSLRRWVRASHTDASTRTLLDVLESVDLQGLADLSASKPAWIDPLTLDLYTSAETYWRAHPAIVWGHQATPRALAHALPKAQPGAFRHLAEPVSDDRAPRWSANGPDGRVNVNRPATVVPAVSVEACYYDGVPPPWHGASTLETAALSLRGGDSKPTHVQDPFACLTLHALDPAESQKEYLDASQRLSDELSSDAWSIWEHPYAILGRQWARREANVWGREGYRAPLEDKHEHGAFLLDELRGVSFRYLPERETDARALVEQIDVDLLDKDKGERVAYAVYPNSDRTIFISQSGGHTPTFEDASTYRYSPAEGLVAVDRTKATLHETGVSLTLPVPQGWALWNTHGAGWNTRGVECSALNVAASPSTPLNPCRADVPEQNELYMYAGRLGKRYDNLLRLLRDFARGRAVHLFGTMLSPEGRQPCRSMLTEAEGALAAVRFSCEVDGVNVETLEAAGMDTVSLFHDSIGPESRVLRALVLEHEEVGLYAVLVVGAAGTGAEADELLDHTVTGLEAQPRNQIPQ